jgi:hypothetical protein
MLHRFKCGGAKIATRGMRDYSSAGSRTGGKLCQIKN